MANAAAIADAHGWGTDRVIWTALVAVPTVDVWQGRFEDAEHWLDMADEVVRPDLEPATGRLLSRPAGPPPT